MEFQYNGKSYRCDKTVRELYYSDGVIKLPDGSLITVTAWDAGSTPPEPLGFSPANIMEKGYSTKAVEI